MMKEEWGMMNKAISNQTIVEAWWQNADAAEIA
jgi:hypothetical protein